MSGYERNKGKRGEQELARFLREHGFPDAARGVQYKGGPGSPDVTGVPGVHLESKRTEKLSLYEAMDQSHRDAADGEVAVVAHRRNGKQWVAILDLADYLDLVREASAWRAE